MSKLTELPWSSLLAGAVSAQTVTEVEAEKMGRVIDALLTEHSTIIRTASLAEIYKAYWDVEDRC